MAIADDETRSVEGLDFDELVVLGSIQVEVSQGDEYALQIRGPAEYLDMNPFRVDGDTLVLGSTRKSSGKYFETLQFRVVMPVLRELSVKGSGDVYVKPFQLAEARRDRTTVISLNGAGDIKLFGVTGGNLELEVKGSGDIKAVKLDVEDLEALVAGSGDLFIQTVQAEYVEFTVTGSGDLTVTDSSFVKKASVNVIGSGDVSADPMDCDEAEVNVLGSGSIRIGRVMTNLEASTIGSGDIRYRGDPEVDSVQLGSGEVRRRN
jgi:hypothetical protein